MLKNKIFLGLSCFVVSCTNLLANDADTAATALACKTINVDAYYSNYDTTNKWWSYVSADKSLVIAHKQGSTVKQMGTEFFLITDQFDSAPNFAEDGSTISFGASNGSSTYSDNLSNGTINVDAYYSNYDTTNKWWSYVSADKSLVVAHEQGSTVAEMGTKFFLITDKFATSPVFSSDGTTVTFGALSGETCDSQTDSEIENPPSVPEIEDTTTENSSVSLPPQVPSI